MEQHILFGLQFTKYCIHSISSKPPQGFSCNFAVHLNRMTYRTHLSVISDQDQGLTWSLGNFYCPFIQFILLTSPAHLSFHFLMKAPNRRILPRSVELLFPYMDIVAILVKWPGPFKQTFFPQSLYEILPSIHARWNQMRSEKQS